MKQGGNSRIIKIQELFENIFHHLNSVKRMQPHEEHPRSHRHAQINHLGEVERLFGTVQKFVSMVQKVKIKREGEIERLENENSKLINEKSFLELKCISQQKQLMALHSQLNDYELRIQCLQEQNKINVSYCSSVEVTGQQLVKIIQDKQLLAKESSTKCMLKPEAMNKSSGCQSNCLRQLSISSINTTSQNSQSQSLQEYNSSQESIVDKGEISEEEYRQSQAEDQLQYEQLTLGERLSSCD